MDDIVFQITKQTKIQARKRRVRHEKKWLGLRIVSWIAFPLSIYAFIKGIFFVDFSDFDADVKYGMIFAISLVAGACARALILGFTSRWTTDRFNERIWVQDGRMYHMLQKSAGGGLNTWIPGPYVFLFILDTDTIKNARYDPKSGRIEFDATGEGKVFSDYERGIVQQDGRLPENFTCYFYDYTIPSLYEYLKSNGVPFTVETIDFKAISDRV